MSHVTNCCLSLLGVVLVAGLLGCGSEGLDSTVDNYGKLFVCGSTTGSSSMAIGETQAPNTEISSDDSINANDVVIKNPFDLTVCSKARPELSALTMNFWTQANSMVGSYQSTTDYLGSTDYHWAFGDGEETSDPTDSAPLYTYATPGQYTVIATITDNKGHSISNTKVVTVGLDLTDLDVGDLIIR